MLNCWTVKMSEIKWYAYNRGGGVEKGVTNRLTSKIEIIRVGGLLFCLHTRMCLALGILSWFVVELCFAGKNCYCTMAVHRSIFKATYNKKGKAQLRRSPWASVHLSHHMPNPGSNTLVICTTRFPRGKWRADDMCPHRSSCRIYG